MNRLDQIFGPGKWKNDYRPWGDKGVLCGISAKIDGEWITKWDGAEETNIEAVKGGLSGSMKRAAVQWGIGRYLYNMDEVWVNVTEQRSNRNSNYIKDKNSGITGYWDTPNLPSWALPNGYKQSPAPAPSQPSQVKPPQAPNPAQSGEDEPADKQMITNVVNLATEIAWLVAGTGATEDQMKEKRVTLYTFYGVKQGMTATKAIEAISKMEDYRKKLLAERASKPVVEEVPL